MIRVFCTCGRAFKAEDRHAGRHTKCPECGADLTIGPVPASSSSGGDVDEVPAWWYPERSLRCRTIAATAPTRSGSDPGPDAVNTMVLPAGLQCQGQAARCRVHSPPAGAFERGSSASCRRLRSEFASHVHTLVRPSSARNSGRSPAGPSLWWFWPSGRSSGSVRRHLAVDAGRRPRRG